MFFFENEEVKNNINQSNLEFIKINGLFGRSDVCLEFNKEVNIYIGENGLGKTTILNCIYYLLRKKYDRLSEIEFRSIDIKFSSENEAFSLNKADINEYNEKYIGNRFRHENRYEYRYEMLFQEILGDVSLEEGFNDETYDYLVRKFSRIAGIPSSIAKQYADRYLRQDQMKNYGNSKIKGKADNVKKFSTLIDRNIKSKVIYLTTYRRIENEFSNFSSKENAFSESDQLIQFGMGDVQKTCDSILNLIRDRTRESFNKMTGVLLKQYSSNIKKSKKLDIKEIDDKNVKIILDRLGNEIGEDEKRVIFDLLNSKEIYNDNYSYLLNLIKKLIDSYEAEKQYDDKIKRFVEICNKYLHDKKFVYNQSDLKLEIKNKDDDTIELKHLSSGEKQIVSLFSKLYLENEKDAVLIIDEPELSISIKWQKILLPDIMRSNSCKLLLTVTHSPFIFDNEFDFDAMEMRTSFSNER